jgi:dienelactone hydrolase
MNRKARLTLAAISLVSVVGIGVVVGHARAKAHAKVGWFSWLPKHWFFNEGATEDEADDEEAAIPDAATIDWCAEGLTAIPGGGCLKVPDTPPPWPLVVYLHGIFDPAAASEELSRQSRVAHRAAASGFATLALRGHVGQCSAPEYAARVCWPSNERNEGAGPAFVEEWRAPLALAARSGARGRRYVFGFSNGGYFAGLLAERDWFRASAFVVARAGPVEPVKATGERYPMLLTLSEDDPSHDEMVKLDTELDKESWAHERFLAQGGHALPDGDVDAALRFFERREAALR